MVGKDFSFVQSHYVLDYDDKSPAKSSLGLFIEPLKTSSAKKDRERGTPSALVWLFKYTKIRLRHFHVLLIPFCYICLSIWMKCLNLLTQSFLIKLSSQHLCLLQPHMHVPSFIKYIAIVKLSVFTLVLKYLWFCKHFHVLYLITKFVSIIKLLQSGDGWV